MDKTNNKTQKKKYYQETEKQSDAKLKIQRFMLNTTIKRRANYLTRVCADSGICIALSNKERQKINKFFENFVNFKHVVTPIKSIDSSSNAAGFIKELKYVKNEYVAYTVLKSVNSKNNDNLMYEYNVGQYLNKLIDYYPCFLETYGLFLYQNHIKWLHSKSVKTISTNVLHSGLILMPEINYRWACMRSNYLAIMIQHIKNANTLYEVINSILKSTTSLKPQFINYELMSILYQIYMPLSYICDTFTHYDLHLDNILLFEPRAGHFIEYHYHITPDKIITFKSKYMVKIIDYGRCYFNDNGNSSLDVYNELCSIDKCDPACGGNVGFATLNPKSDFNSRGLILSQKKNISHDLRCVAMINSLLRRHGLGELETRVKRFFSGVKYNKEYKFFGTEEIILSGYPYYVNNVKDVPKMLEDIIYTSSFQDNNSTQYNTLNKLGDLHIYTNGLPMEFIKI